MVLKGQLVHLEWLVHLALLGKLDRSENQESLEPQGYQENQEGLVSLEKKDHLGPQVHREDLVFLDHLDYQGSLVKEDCQDFQ